MSDNNNFLLQPTINPYYTGNTANSLNANSNVANNAVNNQLFNQYFTTAMMGQMNNSLGSVGGVSDSGLNGGTNSPDYLSAFNSQAGLYSLLGAMGESSSSEGMMSLMLAMLLASDKGGSGSIANVYGQNNNMAMQGIQAPIPGVTGTSAADTPVDAWRPSTPAIVSVPGNRNPSLYRQVLDQFNVESNKRYAVNKNGKNDTYCNIYLWDVTKAMGAEIPHYTNPNTGEPMHPPNNKGAISMNANRINDWLNKHGTTYGWKKVSAEEAQKYANMGMPAVTSWKNPSGHGHVQMVAPSKNGTYDPVKGVAIAQAGRSLINDGHINQVYGSNTLKKVEYFVHV